ncbi:hypothetical protein BABINDRAFT_162253, partial [Babjeviella inositovora NRRL Y-12698]
MANAYTYDEEATAAQIATGYANLIINSTLSDYVGPKYDPQPYLLSLEELFELEVIADSVYYIINGKYQRWLVLPEGPILRYNLKFLEWEAPRLTHGNFRPFTETTEVIETYPVNADRDKLLVAYLEGGRMSQEEMEYLVSLLKRTRFIGSSMTLTRIVLTLEKFRSNVYRPEGGPVPPLLYSREDMRYHDGMGCQMRMTKGISRKTSPLRSVRHFLRYQGWVIILCVACMGAASGGTYYYTSRRMNQNFGSINI